MKEKGVVFNIQRFTVHDGPGIRTEILDVYKRQKQVRQPREKWRKPVIDQTVCSACSMCVDICGFSCIVITYPAFQGDLKVYAQLQDEKKCVGCGLCEKVCPLHAITMKGGE